MDASDDYGISKIKFYSSTPQSERLKYCRVLRGSVIGLDPHGKSLLSWALSRLIKSQPVDGYINHQWNGLTTTAWAHYCKTLISDFELSEPLTHIGTESISKYELLFNVCKIIGYDPVQYCKPVSHHLTIDKTLKLDVRLGPIHVLLREHLDTQERKRK